MQAGWSERSGGVAPVPVELLSVAGRTRALSFPQRAPHESCSYCRAPSVLCGVANPAPGVCRVHSLPPAMGQACIGPHGVFGSWQLLQVPAVVVEALGGLCKLNPRVQQKMFRNGVSRKVWGSPAECSAATF